MAKRKRLTVTSGGAVEESAAQDSPLIPRAPIAHIAGEASASAALEEVAGELRTARETGRLLLELPLDSIDADHLIRDRLVRDDEDMQSLVQSLQQRGQQTPIEVLKMAPGRYGLISGWRRLQALRQLERPTVLSVVRQPETAADAYLAMVEENEIRVGLSYFERARIAAKAAELGLYTSSAEAVQSLFANASRAKRSKIRSFVKLYESLGEALRYPAAISERLGLALTAQLEADKALGQRLRDRLRKTPCGSAEEETGLLQRILAEKPTRAAPRKKVREEVAEGLWLESRDTGKGLTLSLSGPGMTPELRDRLARWLSET